MGVASGKLLRTAWHALLIDQATVLPGSGSWLVPSVLHLPSAWPACPSTLLGRHHRVCRCPLPRHLQVCAGGAAGAQPLAPGGQRGAAGHPRCTSDACLHLISCRWRACPCRALHCCCSLATAGRRWPGTARSSTLCAGDSKVTCAGCRRARRAHHRSMPSSELNTGTVSGPHSFQNAPPHHNTHLILQRSLQGTASLLPCTVVCAPETPLTTCTRPAWPYRP